MRKGASQRLPGSIGRVFAVVVVGDEHFKVVAGVVLCRAEAQHWVADGVEVEGRGDAPVFIGMCGSAAVAVGVGVVVALVCGNGPIHFAFHIDEGPAVHLAFPVLVEDGDHTHLDGVGGLGDGAVIVAFLFGVGPDGHAFVNGDGCGVFRPRSVF